MIEPYQVEHLERRAEPVDPPLKSGPFHHVPSVDRISPKLPRRAEVIGRYARNLRRPPRDIEMKQLRVRPHVSTVVCNIDRDVSHDADFSLAAILPQSFPLPKKLELPILVAL